MLTAVERIVTFGEHHKESRYILIIFKTIISGNIICLSLVSYKKKKKELKAFLTEKYAISL